MFPLLGFRFPFLFHSPFFLAPLSHSRLSNTLIRTADKNESESERASGSKVSSADRILNRLKPDVPVGDFIGILTRKTTGGVS